MNKQEENIHKQLNTLYKQAIESVVFNKSNGVIGDNNDYFIMLRVSRLQHDTFLTLDVVQIGWKPYLKGKKKLEEREKGSATYIWDALEKIAIQNNRRLRIECILSEQLLNYLIRTRGYKLESYHDNTLIHFP